MRWQVAEELSAQVLEAIPGVTVPGKGAPVRT